MEDDLAAVRAHLVQARRQGLEFDAAWNAALGALPRLPANTARGQHRDAALNALAQTADAWRSAYVGEPAPRRERAAAELQSLVLTPT